MTGLLDRPVWQLMLIIVVVGPIFEELVFRSWLSGSPRLLVPFFAFVALAVGIFLSRTSISMDSSASIAANQCW